MLRCVMVCLLSMALFVLPARAGLTPEQAQKMYDKYSHTLVAVQYTIDSEFGRREFTGQGVTVGESGIIMTSLALFPLQIPDSQMKDFKILIPGDDDKELDAVFLGRDERSDVAFLKTKEPQKWEAIKFEEMAVKVGDPIVSIGLLPKDAGYKSYYCESIVSAVLRGPVPNVMVSADGLATVGSPVFNAAGNAIGFVAYQQGQNFLLNANPNQQMMGPPARYYVPSRDFLPSLADMPTGEPLKLPWLGTQLTAVNKEVAELYKLKNVPAAQVGEVIPNSPASRAGLKTGDKIIKLNGQALERGDEPDEVWHILVRKVRRMKVGAKITLTVLRDRNQPTTDIAVTLDEQPRQPNLAKRFYAEDLGMSVREVVFADTYSKRLPPETKGVVVAFVKPASSAATAGLRGGDLATELNKTPISDLEGFQKQYKEFREKHPKELVVLVVNREQKTEVIKIEPPQ